MTRLTCALAALLLLAASAQAIDLLERCKKLTGAKEEEIFVVFVADPGEFSATHEAVHYYANMKGRKELQKFTLCPHAYAGTIMGQKTMVITTGIGPMASVTCIQDILTQCGPLIKDIVYSGTSGWSNAKGGILNNGTCENGTANLANPITKIGDVCVSPLAVNWDCRKTSIDQTCNDWPNQCSFPEALYGPSSDYLFGQCQFTNVSKAQYALADEILAAAKSTARELYPRANAAIQKDEVEFWALMRLPLALAKKSIYNETALKAGPTVWSYTECMEIDSQMFYSSAPWDMKARHYVAETMNKAFGTKNYTQEKVIAVAAMEAIGLGQAMQHYYKMTGRSIPFTNVRGMSNRLHQPVMWDPLAKMWFTPGEVPEDFENGYKYAIATSASTVLATLKARCMALVKAGKLGASACSFKVNYA